MFSTLGIIKKNANRKDYVRNKLKKKLENEDPHHAETIFHSFEFKNLEKTKSKEPFIPPKQTIAKKVELERQKTRTGIEILISKRILTRHPVLSA